MQNPWNKHITRNEISRYIAAEKQRWIESRDYFMRCMFLKQMSYPERLHQKFYMNFMATHYLNQMNSCMLFPPSKHSPPYLCPQPFQFPSSGRAMNSGMLSDRQRHRPTSSRYIRNDVSNVKDWRRECNDERSQTFQGEFDLNFPNASFSRANKDISDDKYVERIRGRKLRSTNWTRKELQSNNNIEKEHEQEKDVHNRSYHLNKYDAKNRPYNYRIHDGHDFNPAEYQWSDLPHQDEEKISHTQLPVERYFTSAASEDITLSNRKEYSSQSQNNNSIPITSVKETSMNITRKTLETSSWAAQMEEENEFMEMPVADTTESWNWFSKEEQQSIVDMLKKEDLKHERQMMQDSSPLKNSNHGKGDSSSPPVVDQTFSHDEHKVTLEENRSSSEDNIVVIVPSDAFMKSLQAFKDTQLDCDNTIAIHAPKSSEVEMDEIHHKLSNENGSSEMIDNEDWGKYCIGWSADNEGEKNKSLNHSTTIRKFSPISTVDESLSDELLRKLKIVNEKLSKYSEMDEQVSSLDINVYVPEYHGFSTLRSTSIKQVVDTPKSTPSKINNSNFESFTSQFENGNEFIRSFESTNMYDYQNSHYTHQSFPSQNFDADGVECNGDDSLNNAFDEENTTKINNIHYGPQRGLDINQLPSIREHYNSYEHCDNVSPPCRNFLRYPSLTINHSCCPRFINAYTDGKIHPAYVNVYQNCPSFSEATTSLSVHEERPSPSIDNEKNISASNFLKLILGISNEIKEEENASLNSSVVSTKCWNSEIDNDKSCDPIPSSSSTESLKCNLSASSSSKKCSAMVENRLINQVQYISSSSPESQNLNHNTDFKNKTSRRLFNCDKSTSAKIKFGTENHENLTPKVNHDPSQKFNLKNTRQDEYKSSSEATGVSSQSNTNFKTTLVLNAKAKKTRKFYKDGKYDTFEQSGIKQCTVTSASTATKPFQKKDSNVENISLKDKHSTKNRQNGVSERNMSNDDLELKTLKPSKVMFTNNTQNITPDKHKNTRSVKCKPPRKLKISERNQVENKSAILDHSNTNKFSKTNAEIAAEYQARRKAKLYHERKMNKMKPERSMQRNVSESSLAINGTNIADREKIETVEKRNNPLETEIIENIITGNKFNRREHHERKLHNPLVIRQTRTEDNKDVNVACTGYENIVNFHCSMSTSTEDETIQRRKDQQRNCNQQISNDDFKERELCYNSPSSIEALVRSVHTMIPYSPSNTYMPSLSMQSSSIPWIMKDNSNLLSQRLIHDLLCVSCIFDESIFNNSSSTLRNSLLQCSSPSFLQVNAFQNINFNSMFQRHPITSKLEHIRNYSLDFSSKFYEYLYHLWRRHYPSSGRTTFSCEHHLDKRVLFASWLQRKLSPLHLKVNER